jgi:hypothetical protein
MSYSFSVQALDKAGALEKVKEKLAEVVSQQPVHKNDQEQALAVAETFINLLADVSDRSVAVSVSGSLSWMDPGDVEKGKFCGANIQVGAYLAPRV